MTELILQTAHQTWISGQGGLDQGFKLRNPFEPEPPFIDIPP